MSLLDFIFPKYSLRGSEGAWITQSELPYLKSHPRVFGSAELKKRGVRSVDCLFSAGAYRECPLLRKAVITFKYKRVSVLGDVLKRLLCDAAGEFYPLKKNACVCPVPLHFTRLYHRGFNQAEILARGLSEKSGVPIHNMLVRIRPTGNQSKRNRARRLRAMKGAFIVKKSFRNGYPFRVYLVDDLFTTGATMEECAKVLKKSGVKRVEGIVLAHG